MRPIASEDGHVTILDEIEGLLAARVEDEGDPSLARLEDTLTAGYAHALALEAERWRLERRLGEVAAQLADQAAERGAEDLADLARRMSTADDDLTRLRSMLVDLRDRADALRADPPETA